MSAYKPCKTCAHRRLTPSRKSTHCKISKWWCGLYKKLIGEGHNKDLEAANGCHKWAEKLENK